MHDDLLIDTIMSMIKSMTVADLLELRRRLEKDPRWPAAGAPVGAKPRSPSPSLSAAAERETEK